MISKKYLDYIKKNNWYKQGGAISLFFVFDPFIAFNELIGYQDDILYQKKELNFAFFNKEKEKKKFISILSKQEKNIKYIDEWICDWEKLALRNLKYIDAFFKNKNVWNWSDKDLTMFLSKVRKLGVKHWKKGVLLEWSDPEGDLILKSYIKKYNVKLSKNDVAVLSGPQNLTFVQEELIDRLKIVKKLKRGMNVDGDIKKHAVKYHWFQNNWYYVHELDAKYFEKNVKQSLDKISLLITEENEIKSYLKFLKKRRLEILNHRNLPTNFTNILYVFMKMTDWRDKRKKMAVCLPNHYLYQIVKRLSVENNISENLIKMLTSKDILGWKISNKTKSELEKRWNGSVYVCDKNKKCEWLYGNKAAKIVNLLSEKISGKELKGVVACRGSVRGIVKVVETKDDFKKMKTGDILVATMTRPEYISLMKIASAIVTDEGGLTCHAAVVSRELNIPCIINTQNATSLLKDGDKVEVDANKGIIKKII